MFNALSLLFWQIAHALGGKVPPPPLHLLSKSFKRNNLQIRLEALLHLNSETAFQIITEGVNNCYYWLAISIWNPTFILLIEIEFLKLFLILSNLLTHEQEVNVCVIIFHAPFVKTTNRRKQKNNHFPV